MSRARTTLPLAALLFSFPAPAQISVTQPPLPPFCASALTHSVTCAATTDCTALGAGFVCTCDYNPRIRHIMPTGRCVDTTGKNSATDAIQADLCSLPYPKNFAAGTLYELPAQSLLRIDDPDGDGYGLTIFRQTILEGNGAGLMYMEAAQPYAILQAVVPLKQMNDPDPALRWNYGIYGVAAGEGSVIRNLGVMPNILTNTVHRHVAILVRAHRTMIENVIANRVGIGLEFDGEGSRFNTDGSRSDSFKCNVCYGATVFSHGGDANAIVLLNTEAIGGVGFLIRGFSTTLVAGGTVEGNTKTSYITGKPHSLTFESGAYSAALAVYFEGSDPDPTSDSWANTFLAGPANVRVQGVAERVGGGYSRLFIRPNSKEGSLGYKLWLGGPGQPLALQSMTEANSWQLREITTEGKKRWMLSSQLDTGAGGFKPIISWPLHQSGVQPSTYTLGPRMAQPNEAPPYCADGVDNDLDGQPDCGETSCSADPHCAGP